MSQTNAGTKGAAGAAGVAGGGAPAQAAGGGSYVLLLAVLYVAAFVAGFNENMMNMGLMDIMSDFGVSSVTAQWLVTAYMIVGTVVVTCMAFLYRRVRLRVLFYVGVALTTAGSLIGLFAPNFPVLLLARVVQACGSGLFIPMMMNTILAVTPKHRLGQFMSIGGCMITFGPAFAPVVTGTLVTSLGWHGVFYAPLVAMVVIAIVGVFALRDLTTVPAELDVPSVALSAVFLFTLSFGLAQLMATPLVGIVALAVAVASAVAFTVRQLRLPNPLIDMTPMRSIAFWPATILVIIAMMTTFSLSVLLPLYFEGALGMSAFTAGVVILVPVLVNAGCTLVAGRIMDRRGEWPLLPAGMLLIVIGAALMAIVSRSLSAPAMFIAALFAYAGIGLAFSPSQTAGLRTLPPQQNPFGVALMTTFVQIAACIGPSLFIGVMSASEAGATAAGADAQATVAAGFSSAITVATCIALVGLIIATVYSLAAHRRDAAARKAAQTAPAPEAAAAVAAPAGAAAAEAGGAAAAAGDLSAASIAAVTQPVPYVISAGAPVRDAMLQLIDHRVSGMPIVDASGAPVGFVSDGDIMRYLVDQHPLITSAYSLLEAADGQSMDKRLEELMRLPVTEICTPKVVSLGINTSLHDACQMLAQHRYKKVPVIADGRVVGVVNRSDVLRFAMERYLRAEDAADGAPAPAADDGTPAPAADDGTPAPAAPGDAR